MKSIQFKKKKLYCKDAHILNVSKGICINPLVPSTHKSVRIAKISILKLEGIIKKFPMSVETMSR